MKDKIVLITGGSSGIGKATAIALAKLGATILIVSRNEQRGQQALTDIQDQSQNSDIHFFCSSLEARSSQPGNTGTCSITAK